MGLPGSSNISNDILPMLIINIAMSVGHIKHALFSFMQVIGLLSAAPGSSEASGAREFPDDHSFCSGLMLSGLSTETRQALPLTAYNPDLHVRAQVDADCSVCLQEFHKDQEDCCSFEDYPGVGFQALCDEVVQWWNDHERRALTVKYPSAIILIWSVNECRKQLRITV
ncbi:hypothetical protein GOP47_0025206 [Adiantum capillus-veneris]|uniref:Uncharacterized protein n=1 Tax=Adiantum capillus-veneris TaxID=13818 RepID=A0A9D4U391_ADICA|nr:hypothetical protein GOP47_0025206 [Adiantum capillus-veneris]